MSIDAYFESNRKVYLFVWLSPKSKTYVNLNDEIFVNHHFDEVIFISRIEISLITESLDD
jgi:hypothetical protein